MSNVDIFKEILCFVKRSRNRNNNGTQSESAVLLLSPPLIPKKNFFGLRTVKTHCRIGIQKQKILSDERKRDSLLMNPDSLSHNRTVTTSKRCAKHLSDPTCRLLLPQLRQSVALRRALSPAPIGTDIGLSPPLSATAQKKGHPEGRPLSYRRKKSDDA